MSDIEKLIDELGLELGRDGKHRIRIFDEDIDLIAETLSYETLDELLQHQIDNENYEGAETLRHVISKKKKNEIQEIQRRRK